MTKLAERITDLSLKDDLDEAASDALRVIEQIASEAGLELGGTLYSDALSPPDGPAPTYADMMRANAHTVATALTAR